MVHCVLGLLAAFWGLSCAGYDIGTPAFVNEFRHGLDAFVEIAIVGEHTAGYEVILYSGENGMMYARHMLDQKSRLVVEGVTLVTLENVEIRHVSGSPNGLALVDSERGIVLQFLSYEGTMVALDGPASGYTSNDVGVDESLWEGSVQLGGVGCALDDFVWLDGPVPSPSELNPHQTFVRCGES